MTGRRTLSWVDVAESKSKSASSVVVFRPGRKNGPGKEEVHRTFVTEVTTKIQNNPEKSV